MVDAIAVHNAFVQGDVDALRDALGDPPDFPNYPIPWGGGAGESCLEYAIYYSPLHFIRTLLDLGADPEYDDDEGYPSLIAALSTERPDKYEIVELLLAFGADIQQRGINDFTPLHYAAAADDARAIDLLLAHGADPYARTRIDHFATPLEEAEHLGSDNAARALRRWWSRG